MSENPFEEGIAYLQRLRAAPSDRIADIAKAAGKSSEYVRVRLKLLSLAKEVQELVADRKLPLHHAATLAILTEERTQVALANEAIHKKLLLSTLRRRVRAQRELAFARKYRPG